MKKSETYTQKEIGIQLNNSVAAALGAVGLKKLPESRKRQLRNYLSAILDTILDHRKKNYLTAEELVVVLACGALFIHVWLVQKGTAMKLAQYEDLAVDLIKDIEDGKKKKK